MSGDGWLDAGDDDLVDGQATSRLVEGRMVMLVRQGGRLHAVDAVCPHKFAMLPDGDLGDACVTCPQHGATFDLVTGDSGDDASWAGALPVHEVRTGDGRLHVRLRD